MPEPSPLPESPSPPERTVAVIGGGIAGLTAAYLLQKSRDIPCRVLLFEKEPRLGGRIQTEWRDGFLIEGGPESFVSFKKGGVELCSELGLKEELLEPKVEHAKTFMLRHRRLVEMPPGVFSPFSQPFSSLVWRFAQTPLLSLSAKLRMAAEPFIPAKRDDEDEPLGHFIERRFGKDFFEKLLGPLFAGVYGGDPSALSAKTVLREYYEAERSAGSVARAILGKRNKIPSRDTGKCKSVFLTLRQGLSSLIEELGKRLQADSVHSSAPVEEVAPSNREYVLKLADGRSFSADALVLATPAHVSARLVANFDSQLAELFQRIPYVSSTILTVGFRRAHIGHPLNGYGFLVPPSQKLSFTACTWSSSKWAGRSPNDMVLLRIYVPGIQPDLEKVRSQTLAQLSPILDIRGNPILQINHAHADSLPQYVVGHQETVAQIFNRVSIHPGLFLAGAPYDGVGIPDCIESAKKAVGQLQACLQRIS